MGKPTRYPKQFQDYVLSRFKPYGDLMNRAIEDCATGLIDIVQATREIVVIEKTWDRVFENLIDKYDGAIGG